MLFKHKRRSTSSPPLSTSQQFSLIPYLNALRPRQWTKNLIVFAAPLFAFKLSVETLLGSLLAFCLFCAVASGFYLINDILDVKSDREHPVKCKRPIAAGLVSIPIAWGMAATLLGSALWLSWATNLGLGVALTLYAMLQVAYNLKLKQTVLLDVVAISAGFILRSYGGAAATNVMLSAWFIVCTAMLSLFLAIEKRKAELRLAQSQGKTNRAVLKRYSIALLNRMESTVTTGTIVAYILWSSGPQLNGASTPWMLLTTPYVLYGIFRYQLLSDPEEVARRNQDRQQYGGSTERPEEVLLSDMPILITVLAWALTTFTILTLKHQGII